MACQGVGLVDRLEAGDPSQIGPFRLLGRLGEGGMGRVFLGESRGGRKVAVKVVHSHYASDPEFRRRFAREVDTARRVGGFHTAAVVGADPEADPPWMATAYIPGPSLAQAIAERGPLDEAGVRELGAALAEGLAAIHDCGLIHRDLKPGNVILAGDGPRIIDFGIAKGTGATALTGSSVVIGTLRYMSPEQLHGQELTPQSDVFALGTVLAFAATGHDPFQGPTIPAVITRILTDSPDLDPLSGDLRDVIGDCLAKDPGSRPSPGDLLARFSDRGTHDPTVTAAPAPVPAPGPVPTPVPSPEPRTAEDRGPARTAQEPSFASTINVSPAVPPGRTDPPAPRNVAAPQLTREPARRRSQRRTGLIAAGAVAAAGLAIAGILTLVNRPGPTLPAAATLTDPASKDYNSIDSVAFGPDGILATGNQNGSTYLWNTTTGKITATFTDPGSLGVNSVAFGPDGILATADETGSTYLWNTTTGDMTATLADPRPWASGGSETSVAFGPGDILAVGDSGGSTYLWNTATGSITATLTNHAGHAANENSAVNSVAFGPDGILATADGDGSTYLWNITTNKITATLTDPGTFAGVSSVAFGPDGILATADGNGSTYLWNTATGKITGTLAYPGDYGVTSVAFGPDDTLACADGGGGDNTSIYLWNTTTGKIIETLTTGRGTHFITRVAFGPDGILAGGGGNGGNGSTSLWHITDG